MNEHAATISAVTAMIAVIVGPLVSVYVTHRQIRSNNLAKISTMRQQWIDDLRNEIATFLSTCTLIRFSGCNLPDDVSPTAQVQSDLMKSQHRIELLLNPNEDDHKALMRLIQEAASLASPIGESSIVDKLAAKNYEVVIKAKEVLKREWERVKANE